MRVDEEFVGPLTPRGDQLGAVVALANRVFRAGGGDMAADYPQLFRRDGLRQLRVFMQAGRPVSLVGTVLGDVAAFGCGLRVACVGSVCTDASARGRGLAGALLDDAVTRARAAGASVMLISGGRSLYRRRGAFSVGRFLRYTMPAAALRPLPGIEVADVGPDEAGEALAVFEAEPIRFRRTRRQYATQIASGLVMGRLGRTCLVRRGGRPAAVVSLNPPCSATGDAAPVAAVRELAGSRQAALAGLADLAGELHAETLTIDAYTCDCALADACAAVGGAAEVVSFSGTVKLLDLGRLWRGFRPLLKERLGADLSLRLRANCEADELGIHTLRLAIDDERLEVRGAREVLAAIFGSPDADPLVEAGGRLGEAVRRALPLPLCLYGMNYV
jgi:predicted N-acetyltransferase YhbS